MTLRLVIVEITIVHYFYDGEIRDDLRIKVFVIEGKCIYLNHLQLNYAHGLAS